MKPTRLLNDDGSASMATIIMLSHHAFRRDVARFAAALADLQPARAVALREEWSNYRNGLHGHHEVEDAHIFPGMRSEHAELAAVIEQLSADHAKIDPLLERGDRAFAALPEDAAAVIDLRTAFGGTTRPGEPGRVIAELGALLDAHLDREEASIIPLLRDAKEFPAPPTDADAELYAGGFAWSTHGIAQEVLDQVYRILPDSLTSRLPAARVSFHERCERVWGSCRAGESTTSIPQGLP